MTEKFKASTSICLVLLVYISLNQSVTFLHAAQGTSASLGTTGSIVRPHSIIFTEAGAGGSISPSGDVVVADGGDQSFTITPDSGYHVLDVLVDGVSVGAVGSYGFTGVTADHTIEASFEADEYTLTVNVVGGGSVSLDPSQPMYHYGDVVDLTTNADPGWAFSGWSGDLGSSASPEYLTMDGDKTVTATFTETAWTITASAGSGGSISPSGNVVVAGGSDQGFAVSPGSGYHIVDVLVDGSSVGAVVSYEFTGVTADHTIAASFKADEYTLTVNIVGGGSVSLDPDQTSYTASSSVELTASADPGWAFSGWSGDLGGSVNPESITMDGDKSVTATFTETAWTISTSAGLGGSISPSGDVSVAGDDDQSFTVTPDVGYHIADVLVDDVSVGAVGSYQFTGVTADHTIEASFEADELIGLIVDGGFEYSHSSEYLRANSATQDWYESRDDVPTLLTLDKSDVGGDATRKAALKNAGVVENAYLTQEFSSPQNGVFTLTYDINIDRIDDSANYDRTGLMQVGDDSVSTANPPAGTHNERFAFLGFYDPTPGDSGSDLEIRARTSSLQDYATTSQWTQIASGLSYDRWYTVKLVIDVDAGVYDVYVDDVLKGESISKYSGYTSNTVTHLSFSAVSDGRGDYYLDNVEAEELSVDYWSITASAGHGGSISPSGEISVAGGGDQGFTITPSAGYHIANVLVDSISVGPVGSYDFTDVTADHTIEASFEADTVTWTISASAGLGGSIDPVGDVVVADGGDQGFVITPDSGYHVLDVLVDGVSVGAVGSYGFTGVTADHAIAASFEADEYTLIINVIGLGSVDINPDEASYSYGDIVELSAVSTIGWTFMGWSGDLSGSSNPATLSIIKDSTVTAIFIEDTVQQRTEFIYFSSSALTLEQHLQGAVRAYTTRVNHDRSPLSGFPEDAGPLMRAVNPNCLVLKYMNVAHIYDYDPDFQRYRANGWLVKDEVRHISHSSEVVLDLHIPECRHDVALRAKIYVENYGYDGIFGDYLGKPFAYNKNHYGSLLYHQDGTIYTDEQMTADMAALIAEMRALDCGFLLGNAIPQATGSYGYYNSNYYTSSVMLTSLLDMFMIEGSFGWDATEGATRTVYDWEKMIQLYQESAVPQVFYSKSLGSNDKALFVYCSYMMTNPGHDQPLHYSGFSAQMGSYWTNLINDVPGDPLGSMQTYGGTEVRYRAYTNGTYYVNPSPTQTYIVEGVSMGPKSGMIIRP